MSPHNEMGCYRAEHRLQGTLQGTLQALLQSLWCIPVPRLPPLPPLLQVPV